MDALTAAVNALTRALSGELHQSAEDDVVVHPIPADGWPILFKVTVRGRAKLELDRLLSSITGRTKEGPDAVWVLHRQEVQSLIRAIQVLSGA